VLLKKNTPNTRDLVEVGFDCQEENQWTTSEDDESSPAQNQLD
jgi:hypothetical protein